MFSLSWLNWFNFFGKQPKSEDCWWTPEGEARLLRSLINKQKENKEG